MDLQLSITGKRDLTQQIYRQLRERILDGRLKAGERLPASRELAEELDVSRKTITNVYDLLFSEGFLDTRMGSGTFVAKVISDQKSSDSRINSPLVVSKQWQNLSSLLNRDKRVLPYNFDVGVPDTSQFPFPLWRTIIGSCTRRLSYQQDNYGDSQGHKPLREAIAKYISFTRAVVCKPDEIVVTNGAQHAFALIAYALIETGSIVAIEQPGYERARWLFEAHGANIIDVPVDEEGIIVDQLPDKAKLIYVTPSHQFPLGVCMSLNRRLALLEWAAKRGAAIIEDDYDSEFRYVSRPLDSLQSLDRHGVVLYVGTFSKVLFPGVRTGFVVAPESVRTVLIAVRQLTDWHGSLLTQAALAKFINEGHLARHIRKMRTIYGYRRKQLIQYIETEAKNLLKLWPSTAGLHLAASLNSNLSASAVVENAKKLGVYVMPFGDNGLAIGYGAIESDRVEKGISCLVQTIKMLIKQKDLAV